MKSLCYEVAWAMKNELRKRWAFGALPGFAVGGVVPFVGAPACPINFFARADRKAGQPDTAAERQPSVRLHLLSRKGLRLNKFDSLRAPVPRRRSALGSAASSAFRSSLALTLARRGTARFARPMQTRSIRRYH